MDMKKMRLPLLAICLITCGNFLTASAQSVCSSSAVYFDSGKHDLTPAAMQCLDSLLRTWQGKEVLVELEGHTDSTKSVDFNQALSERRVQSVQNHLKEQSSTRFTFRTFARSENNPASDNGTAEGRAINRRVTLQYVALKGGNFEVSTTEGQATASIPVRGMGDCSVCNTTFQVTYYGTDKDIAEGGFGMMTESGEQLTTGGMMSLNSSCTELTSTGNSNSVVFEFPVNADEPEFGGWVTDANGLWREMPARISNGRMRMTVPNYAWGRGINCDCRYREIYMIADSSGFQTIHAGLFIDSTYTRKSTASFSGANSLDTVKTTYFRGLDKDRLGNLWLARVPVSELEIVPGLRRRCSYMEEIIARREHFQPVAYGSQIQSWKVKKSLNVREMHYVIKDAEYTLPIRRIGKRKFEAPVLNYPHTLRLTTTKGRKIEIALKSLRMKRNKKNGHLEGRITNFPKP